MTISRVCGVGGVFGDEDDKRDDRREEEIKERPEQWQMRPCRKEGGAENLDGHSLLLLLLQRERERESVCVCDCLWCSFALASDLGKWRSRGR